MSITPTTSDATRYTVIGSRQGGARDAVQAILLLRGERMYRSDAIASLLRSGLESPLVVARARDAQDLDTLAPRFPDARFLVFEEDVGDGEALNLAIRECKSRFAYVLWDDLLPDSRAIPARSLERIDAMGALCAIPRLEDAKGLPLPFVAEPALHRGSLKIVASSSESENAPALFPPDYAGLYDREAFLRIGGFDPEIANPYWQRLDFGFRAYMFGESIKLFPSIKLAYSSSPAISDSTPDESYSVFYLHTLALKYSGDQAHLPYSRFLPYARRCKRPVLRALGEFRRARAWAAERKYRFKRDAVSVIDLWEGDIA